MEPEWVMMPIRLIHCTRCGALDKCVCVKVIDSPTGECFVLCPACNAELGSLEPTTPEVLNRIEKFAAQIRERELLMRARPMGRA